MIKRLLCLGFILFAAACNSGGEEPRVMTRQGALEAEIRHAAATKKRIDNSENLRQHTLGREEVYELKTEFAFWQKAILLLDEQQLAKAFLKSRPEDNGRFEEFYFDKDGNLVLARDGDLDEFRDYYFVIDRLVLAMKNNSDTLNISASHVKFTAINLVKEAAKLKAVTAKN